MRYELSDHEWTAIKPMLPNKPRGVRRVNDRRVLNGIFWVLRSGAPWRDLPETYGPYTTCYNRFVRWRQAGVWDQIMDALAAGHDAAVVVAASAGLGQDAAHDAIWRNLYMGRQLFGAAGLRRIHSAARTGSYKVLVERRGACARSSSRLGRVWRRLHQVDPAVPARKDEPATARCHASPARRSGRRSTATRSAIFDRNPTVVTLRRSPECRTRAAIRAAAAISGSARWHQHRGRLVGQQDLSACTRGARARYRALPRAAADSWDQASSQVWRRESEPPGRIFQRAAVASFSLLPSWRTVGLGDCRPMVLARKSASAGS